MEKRESEVNTEVSLKVSLSLREPQKRDANTIMIPDKGSRNVYMLWKECVWSVSSRGDEGECADQPKNSRRATTGWGLRMRPASCEMF